MLIETGFAVLVGLVVGTVTGLLPGVHINLVATILLSLPFLSFFDPLVLVVFVVSMAITHTYTDFIPSTFLGAPDEDTALGVLPGHKFLLKGRGHYALKLTVVGSLIGTFSLLLVVPLLWFGLPLIYPFLQQMMAFFLVWISLFLLLTAKDEWRASLVIFLLSGLLGYVVLSSDLLGNPLLPLFSGLFGASTLLHSMKSRLKVPVQETDKIPVMKEDVMKPALATIVVSPLCSVFPGLGSSQAAVIGSTLLKRLTREQFLVLLGSINTLVMAVSFFSLYLINKTRTGAAAAVSELLVLSPKYLLVVGVVVIVVSILASMSTLRISRSVALNIHRVNYTKMSLFVLGFLMYVVFWFSGFFGLFVFGVGTYVGLACIRFGVRRSFLMGVVLVPTIIYYLPW